MRISDLSSDVCSSYLIPDKNALIVRGLDHRVIAMNGGEDRVAERIFGILDTDGPEKPLFDAIGDDRDTRAFDSRFLEKLNTPPGLPQAPDRQTDDQQDKNGLDHRRECPVRTLPRQDETDMIIFITSRCI